MALLYIPFPSGSFQPHSEKNEGPTLSANARGCTVDSKPRVHAMEFVQVQKWEGSVGGGACCGGVCLVYPSVLCSWELLEDRDQLLSSPHLWSVPATPCLSKCPEHPSRCCELLVCGKNSTGGGVAPKACGPPPLGPSSAFCETKYSPQLPTRTPDSLLGPTQGTSCVSCLGLGNPLKSRPPSGSLPNAY